MDVVVFRKGASLLNGSHALRGMAWLLLRTPMSGRLVSGTLDLYGERPHVDECGGHTLVCRRQAAHLAISIRRRVAVVAREIDVGERLAGSVGRDDRVPGFTLGSGRGCTRRVGGSRIENEELAAKVAGFHESWIAGIGPGRLTLVTAVAGPVEQQLSQMEKLLGCVPAVRGQPHILHRRHA